MIQLERFKVMVLRFPKRRRITLIATFGERRMTWDVTELEIRSCPKIVPTVRNYLYRRLTGINAKEFSNGIAV